MTPNDPSRAAPTPIALEAKLIVLRKLVSLLVAASPADSRIRDFLSERATYADGQEDPGSVPEPAFALEAAIAAEFRLIAEEVDRYGAGYRAVGSG
jgi:hypothetical protein